MCTLFFTGFCSVDQIIRMRWAEHVACMGDRAGACRVLVGIMHWKGSIGSLRRSWENIIEMYLQDAECAGL